MEKYLTSTYFILQHCVHRCSGAICDINAIWHIYVLGHKQEPVNLTEVEQESIDSHNIAVKYYTNNWSSM